MANEKKVNISHGILLSFLLFLLLAVSLICQANPRTNSYQYNILDEWKKDEGLPQNSVTAITQTADGYLWFGTTEGLARFDGINFSIFNSNNTPQFKTNRILCLFLDRDGSLWIGTEGGGLVMIEGQTSTSMDISSGLPSNTICNILEDEHGNLWLATAKGILQVSKEELKMVCERRKVELTCRYYDTSDGLPSNECVKWSQYSALKSKDGNLWFATITGLCMIDPENIGLNKTPPLVRIEEIFVDGQKIPLPIGEKPLSPKKTIAFKFTALTFISPLKVRFRYRLENHDHERRGKCCPKKKCFK